ncbi:MAG: hypothetical protein HY707_01995 [Ignavibacteriae bacterium]|nr:hypothetical protein [Ignavibacteriota bacterium]
MKHFIIYSVLVGLVLSSCTEEIPDNPVLNLQPRTFMWLFPDSTIHEGNSRQHIRWWGEDPDGVIKGYLFAAGKFLNAAGQLPSPDTITWRWVTVNDSIVAFPLLVRRDTFEIAVRAVDNTFTGNLQEQAVIRFVPFVYHDKNDNGVFDGDDEQLPSLADAADPRGATLRIPLLNQPPSVTFAPNPNKPEEIMQQPETTYTTATFSWVGTDPDGDKTIAEYRIALNDPSDSSRWVSLPGNISLISLYVPRSRSDTAGSEVTADLYGGKFLSRQFLGQLSGLKLNALNRFYVQARDVAGDFSKVDSLPAGLRFWYVRKPSSRLLAVIDYITADAESARRAYRAAFSQINLPSGNLGNYDEINIGRGINVTDKQNAAAGLSNPRFGALVPPFIDPAFIYTLFLYDYVFWYTDQYPSIPVAQLSLFQYYNSIFDGRRGKVIFSTTFGTRPDPRGLLRDFAPIDSVSVVNLVSGRPLPTYGDSRIPGGYYVYPDSSEPSNIYPTLRFNTNLFAHLVSLRPIFKRADARYIYHMQKDVPRGPTIPPLIRYTYLATLYELRSLATINTKAWTCGMNGVIFHTDDVGQTWDDQASGTSFSLYSIQFLDENMGWIVGEDGTILKTNDGGSTWENQSVLTYEDLLNIHFPSPTNGIVVGTKGLLIRTTDGGSSWTSSNSRTNQTLRSVHFMDQIGIAVGDSGVITRSSDGGASWQQVPSGTNRKLNWIRFINNSIVWVVGANGVNLKSPDGGLSWTSQPTFTGSELRSLYFLDESNGWICGEGGTLYKTANGGSSWSSASSGVTQHLDGIAFANSNEGLIVGGSTFPDGTPGGGLILHTNGGGSMWITQPDGDLNVAVIDGTKTFVFLGLPLHILNGDRQPNAFDAPVKLFLEHVLLREFGQ